MNLADHDKKILPRKVRHEFGHALGLYHAHQLSDDTELLIPYDETKVLDYYMKKCKWDATKTRKNVLSPIRKVGIHNHQGMDQFSVMLYPVIPELLQDSSLRSHFNSSENQRLSVHDRLHIMSMYPGRRPPAVQATSASFRCPVCCQAKADRDSADPRFKYSANGRCLACFWTQKHPYACQGCGRRQEIPYELMSTDTWACHQRCSLKRKWRPVF